METVIIGAGFAGLSTAYHLARRGVRGVVVVEREAGPGVYASGRNAGLLRQSSDDAVLVPLLRAGARVARRILARVPGAIRRDGSLILGSSIDRLRAGSRAEFLDAGSVLPGLAGRALFDPEDATVDPHALLGAYEEGARRRGVAFAYGEEVVALPAKGGRIDEVVTTRGTRAAERVVVAAGAWSGEVAGLAGSRSVAVRPMRRHLFRGRLKGRDSGGWPFVWDEETGVYFRPEGDGLLLSPCDVEPYPARAPECDDAARDRLAEKLGAAFGALGEWQIGPGWACLRTFADDHRFLIGPDPSVANLSWVAGLGGHGLTASWAVGRLAARTLLGAADAGPLAPGRFA